MGVRQMVRGRVKKKGILGQENSVCKERSAQAHPSTTGGRVMLYKKWLGPAGVGPAL